MNKIYLSFSVIYAIPPDFQFSCFSAAKTQNLDWQSVHSRLSCYPSLNPGGCFLKGPVT